MACTKHHSIVGTTAGSICPWVPLGAYVPAGPVRNKRRRPEDTSTLRPPLKLQSLVNQMMLLNHGGAQLVSEGFADHLSVERENDGLYSKYRERGGERRVLGGMNRGTEVSHLLHPNLGKGHQSKPLALESDSETKHGCAARCCRQRCPADRNYGQNQGSGGCCGDHERQVSKTR